MKRQLDKILYGLRLTAMVSVLVFVAVSQFGCEPEESTRPVGCGSGLSEISLFASVTPLPAEVP